MCLKRNDCGKGGRIESDHFYSMLIASNTCNSNDIIVM